MHEKVPVMIGLLAQVAWADGKLLPAEASFFSQIIDALDLSSENEKAAWRAVVCPTQEITPEEIALLSVADRQQVLAMSRDMAICDGDMSDEERDLIKQLRQRISP